MARQSISCLGALLTAWLSLAPPAARAAVVFEIFTDRAAFDARLGVAPRVIDFDDIDTSADDPVPFAANRYKYDKGAVVAGEDGQFVSRAFDPGSNMPPASLPNEYAPGPVSDVLGAGGNETDVTFFSGLRPALAAGFGVVFIDPDFPLDGPSSFTVFDRNGSPLATTGTVSGADGSQVFRGIVAIEDTTDTPVAAIFRAHLVTGQGWAGNPDNESVALDDLVIGDPQTLAGLPGENCENCVDDDMDGAIDRFDTECLAPALGTVPGLGDPRGLGKTAVACQKATEKAGAKFAASKLKHLQQCLQAVARCVQEKNGDTACLDKASGKCTKEIDKIGSDEGKATSAIAKACGPLDAVSIQGGAGLGYDAELKACAVLGLLKLDSAADIAECVLRDHECRLERLVSTLEPRAREYLTAAGRNVALEFPCIGPGVDGLGQGLPTADHAKAILKCEQALQKAGAALLKNAFKTEQACADATAGCLQQKPADPKCLPKVQTKCAKQIAKLLDAEKGTVAKLLAKTLAGCAASSVADLAGPQGLGLSGAAVRCTELGFDPGVPAELVQCFGVDHLCEAARMAEKQVPRIREFGDRLSVQLPESLHQ